MWGWPGFPGGNDLEPCPHCGVTCYPRYHSCPKLRAAEDEQAVREARIERQAAKEAATFYGAWYLWLDSPDGRRMVAWAESTR